MFKEDIIKKFFATVNKIKKGQYKFWDIYADYHVDGWTSACDWCSCGTAEFSVEGLLTHFAEDIAKTICSINENMKQEYICGSCDYIIKRMIKELQ